jgi:hypothetical protein
MKKYNFVKVINPCKMKVNECNYTNVFMKITYDNDNLIICGVIDPIHGGNCSGSCGQINMEFKHSNPAHNDTCYNHLIRFNTGWDERIWYKFLEVWNLYHLNNLQAGCEHQRKLGWGNESIGKPCPTCGYKYGTKCLRIDVPEDVLKFLSELPETRVTPAWI